LVPPFNSGDDFVWVLGPGKGFWVCIGVVEEAVDGIFEFPQGSENAALETLLCELGKEALDSVEPGTWDEQSASQNLGGILAASNPLRSDHTPEAICCPARAAQWSEPSLSISVLNPSGIRGILSSPELLHRPQGAPAAPQLQALGPSHGREM
jgi:hypothetical protein